MTLYRIPEHYNQSFMIDYNGETLTIELRYIPLNKGWYLSIPGVVNGIKVSLSMPILASYGYEKIFFIKENNAIDWLGEMDNVYIVVLTEEELEDVVTPVLVADQMGLRII